MRKENDRSMVKLKEIAEIIMGQSQKSEFYSGRFLYYLLKGNIMEITTLGSGSVYAAINKSAIENLEIEILPVDRRGIRARKEDVGDREEIGGG